MLKMKALKSGFSIYVLNHKGVDGYDVIQRLSEAGLTFTIRTYRDNYLRLSSKEPEFISAALEINREIQLKQNSEKTKYLLDDYFASKGNVISINQSRTVRN